MNNEYSVELLEIDWQYHENWYPTIREKGYMSFGMGNITEFMIFSDVKVFWLMFHDGKGGDDREAWADPLRVEVLKRISFLDWNWYLSFIGFLPNPLTPAGYLSYENFKDWDFLKENNLNYIPVNSHERGRKGSRFYFEVPGQLIEKTVFTVWPNARPGYTLQGYQLPPDRISIISDWGKQERDQSLFRKVIDNVFVAFYTFPSENRHFAFLSNKIDYDQIKALIKLEELQEMAKVIGSQRSSN